MDFWRIPFHCLLSKRKMRLCAGKMWSITNSKGSSALNQCCTASLSRTSRMSKFCPILDNWTTNYFFLLCRLRQAHRACRNAITQLLFADNSLRLGQLDKVDSHMSSVSDKLRIAVLTIKYLDSLDKAVNGTDNDNGYGISPWWLLPYLLLILLFAAYRSDQFDECMKCCGQCMVKDILTSPRDLRRLGHFTYRELLASRPIRVAKIRAEAEKAKKELSLP